MPTAAGERSPDRLARIQDDAELGTADVRLGRQRSGMLPTSSERTILSVHTLLQRMETEQSFVPCENVYSYHMFIVPIESRRNKGMIVVCLAWFLVIINLVMQFWLLSMVGQYVINKNQALIDSVIQKDTVPWYRAHEGLARFVLPAHESGTECRDSTSLCFDSGKGDVTCAPPSIQVLQQWTLLDTNGDGVWSRDEASDEELRRRTQCHYNVDSLVLFEDIVDNLAHHTTSLEGRLHPDIVRGDAIHKAYFDYFLGEPMLCQYGDQDMCGTLFERGVFDAALLSSDASVAARGIHDVKSARDYCQELLTHRCDALLPSTYRVWKVSSVQQCGAKLFTPFKYKHPGGKDGEEQWMLRVGFAEQIAFTKASSWEFMCYLAVLMFIFLAVMFEEAKGIYQTFQWVFCSGVIAGERVAASHRISVTCINLMRTVLFAMLLYSGIVFLSEDTDVLHLIFDALSLVFIIQIDEHLYATLLRKHMKHEHLDLDAVSLKRSPYCIPVMAMECIRVAFLTLASFAICYAHNIETVEPLRNALQCLCTVEGEHCYEASNFDAEWWRTYWTVTLPQATKDISTLVRSANLTRD